MTPSEWPKTPYNTPSGTVEAWPDEIEVTPSVAVDHSAALMGEIERFREKSEKAHLMGDDKTAEMYDQCKKSIQDILWNQY